MTTQDDIKMMIEINKQLDDNTVLDISVDKLCRGLGISKQVSDNLIRNYYKKYDKKVQGLFIVSMIKDGRLVQKLVKDIELRTITDKIEDIYLIGIRSKRLADAELNYNSLTFAEIPTLEPRVEEKSAAQQSKNFGDSFNKARPPATHTTGQASQAGQHTSVVSSFQHSQSRLNVPAGAISGQSSGQVPASFVGGFKRTGFSDSNGDTSQRDVGRVRPNNTGAAAPVRNAWRSNFGNGGNNNSWVPAHMREPQPNTMNVLQQAGKSNGNKLSFFKK